MIAFGLWAECESAESADRLAAHFMELEHTLISGKLISWRVELRSDVGTHGIDIWSPNLSRSGIRTVADMLEVSEAGVRLYRHLLLAPDFLYAHVDWEAANVPLADLPEYIATYADGERRLDLSCVITDSALEKVAPIARFRPFRPGYSWLPYDGERYLPFDSTDHRELAHLRAELLPEQYHP